MWSGFEGSSGSDLFEASCREAFKQAAALEAASLRFALKKEGCAVHQDTTTLRFGLGAKSLVKGGEEYGNPDAQDPSSPRAERVRRARSLPQCARVHALGPDDRAQQHG